MLKTQLQLMVSGEAGPNGLNVMSIVELAFLSESESAGTPRMEAWTAKEVLRTQTNAQRKENALVQSLMSMVLKISHIIHNT
jgi:hypothetical protein